MILILACAGLFVMILYSPIGSPENYVQSRYSSNIQGVSFSAKILNASKIKSTSSNYSESGLISMNIIGSNSNLQTDPNVNIEDKNINVTIPEYNSGKQNTAKYAVVNTNTSDANHETATYSVAAKSDIVSNQNTGGFSGGGGIANAGGAIIGKTSNGNNNPNPQPTGFAALSVDLSIFSDLTTRQGGGYTAGSGATDPGEDPIIDPVPVPDGFWLLLLMAVGYTSLKFLKRKKLEQV